MQRVMVRGTGEFGSAIAVRLFRAGYTVVLHDSPAPDACHRTMALADAIFDGHAELDGVAAVLVADLSSPPSVLEARAAIPVLTAPIETACAAFSPDVVLDARMRKRVQPEVQRGLAPLTIGVGPNFTAGETADLAVETGFGEDFGRVLSEGGTRPLEGEPPPVLGIGRQRFLYAPADGLFRTTFAIGDAVREGDMVGTLDGATILAPVDGALRALVHDGVPVTADSRLLVVDPHGGSGITYGIGPRQARIAEVVLTTLQTQAGDSPQEGAA
jgi:xanthine dehydrogenase accessory factor